jgi:hypothetical protein
MAVRKLLHGLADKMDGFPMAFIKQFQRNDMTPRKSLHKESKGSYSTFEHQGRTFVQFVTYGHGPNPNKITQTIQLDRDGAFDLFTILKNTFVFK